MTGVLFMERTFPDDFKNRIFNEDCLKLMKELPDGAVSLILTDPPYGIRKKCGVPKLADSDFQQSR